MIEPTSQDDGTLLLPSTSEAHTEAIGAILGRVLVGGEVVALHGDLGAGKTRFVRGLAAGLGIDPQEISSPTFVICQEHRGRRLDLAHLDAYRLQGPQELESVGFDELRQRSDMVLAIEWPRRVHDALPQSHIEVHIAHAGPEAREIAIRGDDAALAALRRELVAERCRTCRRPLEIGSPTAPFCSERCRLIDLGAWMAEDREDES